jgi:hypothetical protein
MSVAGRKSMARMPELTQSRSNPRKRSQSVTADS